MILSALLFLAGVFAYSIKELQSFNKLRWQNESKPLSFWSIDSWKRKYKVKWMRAREGNLPDFGQFIPAPDNFYYSFFKIKYKERFPLSATLLVFLTDGAHAMQFFYKLLFCAAFSPLTNWWFPVILWVTWGLVFSLCDKYLTK